MNKKTVFFWLGIAAAVLLLAYVGYGISAYNTQVNYYVEYYQGTYTVAQVKELMPFFPAYLSDKGTNTILLLILTALLFIADALVKTIRSFFEIFELAVLDECCCDEDCGCEDCTEEKTEEAVVETTEAEKSETENAEEKTEE